MSDGPLDVGRGQGPLAIICGGGSLPYAVAEAVVGRGRGVVLFAIRGFADASAVARYPHHWFALGQAGRFRRLARAAGCHDVVFIGSLVRPPISKVRLDWLTLMILPQILRSYRGGDDHLLSGLARIFEQLGFHLVAPQELAPEILAREGTLGRIDPSARDAADIARGLSLIASIGAFDVGQAVVVADNRVLAVEAAEGTDGMLDRVTTLRREGRIGVPDGVGVLIKAPKPNQDRRFDLPSIGPRTIEGVARAGLAGLAVVAGRTIIAEPAQVALAADRAGLFVVGMPAEESCQ
jgi:DUF1009 family protein